MLIVLKQKHDDATLDHVLLVLQTKYDCPGHVIGENRRVIAVPGDTAHVDIDVLKNLDGVRSVDRVDRPYRLASRECRDRTEIELKPGCVVGSREQVVLMAGPCSVESREQLRETATLVHDQGVRVLRGGAFKPRTGPYSFNGLGEQALRWLREIGDELGMAVISEAMNEEQIDLMAQYVDVVQIGARNMQNYDLLRKAGSLRQPVMLKRGLAATLEEWLLAAEYILAGGNEQVILCERGIRTFEQEVRFTLCLGSLPALRELTHLPIIVDPSHAAGTARWVADLAKAGVAVGADGLIVEVHPRPEEALSDGPQSLDAERWHELVTGVGAVAAAVNRRLA